MMIMMMMMIIIIINGNFYSGTNYPCKGSLAALYNDINTQHNKQIKKEKK